MLLERTTCTTTLRPFSFLPRWARSIDMQSMSWGHYNSALGGEVRLGCIASSAKIWKNNKQPLSRWCLYLAIIPLTLKPPWKHLIHTLHDHSILKHDKCDEFSYRGLGCGCEAGNIDISEDSWYLCVHDGTWIVLECLGYLFPLPVKKIDRNKGSSWLERSRSRSWFLRTYPRLRFARNAQRALLAPCCQKWKIWKQEQVHLAQNTFRRQGCICCIRDDWMASFGWWKYERVWVAFSKFPDRWKLSGFLLLNDMVAAFPNRRLVAKCYEFAAQFVSLHDFLFLVVRCRSPPCLVFKARQSFCSWWTFRSGLVATVLLCAKHSFVLVAASAQAQILASLADFRHKCYLISAFASRVIVQWFGHWFRLKPSNVLWPSFVLDMKIVDRLERHQC